MFTVCHSCTYRDCSLMLMLASMIMCSMSCAGDSAGLCGDPGIPVHGIRLGEEFSVGSIVYFSCEPGYTLKGSPERSCLANGTWLGTQPECHGEKCVNIAVK